MYGRRHFLEVLGASGAAMTAGQAAGMEMTPPVPTRPTRQVNVLDFGAKADGTTDDTMAFNRATAAGRPWSTDVECSIIVPAGRYRIDGTVYVRKGQMLRGDQLATFIDCHRAKQSTFVLGRGGADEKDDPGGSPVGIAGFRALGGSDRHGLIRVHAAGFIISDLFLSAPGIGIEVNGADGIIANVAIDQGLNGIVFRDARNITATGLNMFSVNTGITFGGNTQDVTISNAVFCYSGHAAVMFMDREVLIRAISFTGCNFLQNVQADTFIGFIHCRASDVDAQFTGCSFRNWREHAIRLTAGVNAALTFCGCVFDGNRTNETYWHSSNAKGILAAAGNGHHIFSSCSFRGMRGEIARVADPTTRLAFDGGDVRDCDGPRMVVQDAVSSVAVKDVRDFGRVRQDAAHHWVTLPWLGSFPNWRLTASASGAGANFVEEMALTFDRSGAGDNGTISCALTRIWSSHISPTPLADACFGSRPGGPRAIGIGAAPSELCVFIPRKRNGAETLHWLVQTLP